MQSEHHHTCYRSMCIYCHCCYRSLRLFLSPEAATTFNGILQRSFRALNRKHHISPPATDHQSLPTAPTRVYSKCNTTAVHINIKQWIRRNECHSKSLCYFPTSSMKFACLVITRWNTTQFMTVHYNGVLIYLRRRKRRLKGELAFFRSSSQLFHFTFCVKCRRNLLELNS